jgi:hypothetical protein
MPLKTYTVVVFVVLFLLTWGGGIYFLVKYEASRIYYNYDKKPDFEQIWKDRSMPINWPHGKITRRYF